jgi:hypothetical protein
VPEPDQCPACGLRLTTSGEPEDPDPFLEDPHHVFCDFCGEAEHPADLTPDWNGETGNHLSCERVGPLWESGALDGPNYPKPTETHTHA